MRQVGSILFILGALATVLGFMNSVPSLLMWIYNWGETTAWIIKIGLIIVGAVLYFMGNKDEVTEE